MAITVTRTNSREEFGQFSDGSDSIGFGATTAAGATLVAVIGIKDDNTAVDVTITSVADDGGNTYTPAVSTTHTDAGLGMRLAVYYCEDADPAATVTITLSGNISDTVGDFTVYELDGAATSSSLDDTVSAQEDANTTHASGNVTTTEDGGILIGGTLSSEGVSLDANFTPILEGFSSAHGYRIVTTATNYSMTNTTGDFAPSISVLAAFKADAGGGEEEPTGGVIRGWLMG
jgi:hypothetical protein